METIIDGYKFTIEENNANNIILEKIGDGGNVISAIKQFIIFLHKNQIQYVTIYDCKKRDRYKNILFYIYKNANNTEKWLYDMSTFIYDEERFERWNDHSCKVKDNQEDTLLNWEGVVKKLNEQQDTINDLNDELKKSSAFIIEQREEIKKLHYKIIELQDKLGMSEKVMKND